MACYRWADVIAVNPGTSSVAFPMDAIVRIEREGSLVVFYTASGTRVGTDENTQIRLPTPVACAGGSGSGSSTGLAVVGVAAALGLYFVMQSSPGGLRGLSGYHRRGRRRRRRR